MSSKLWKSNSKYANDLINLFVAQFLDFYGSDMLGYNIRNLIHISADVERFGPLDSFSAFLFESFLGHLKNWFETRALPQIIRRVSEKILQRKHNTLTCRQQDKKSLKKHDFGPFLSRYGMSLMNNLVMFSTTILEFL